MKRYLVLLLALPILAAASCGTPRRPANDEITIRLTAPEEAPPRRSGRPDASAASVNDLRRGQGPTPSGGRSSIP